MALENVAPGPMPVVHAASEAVAGGLAFLILIRLIPSGLPESKDFFISLPLNAITAGWNVSGFFV